ncbi:MAG: alpha/beta hydrolase family esterase [Pikeienuella sp.]
MTIKNAPLLRLASIVIVALIVLGNAKGRADSCGGPDEACETPLGSYHIAKPDNATSPPIVLFFHGGGGWGTRIFTMRAAMTKVFTDRGYAVIAPNGKKRPGSRFGPGWSFIPQLAPIRDEVAFTKEIIADAAKRHGFDTNRVLLTGYSIGGSVASYIACWEPGVATAFAPVAGGFWRPHPTDCNGPVRLLHTHGWRDQTVPLEGRPIRNTGIKQGDIYQTLDMWRTQNGCHKYRPDHFVTEGDFWRRIWTHCQAGALEFALHPGGHEIPTGWPALALDWFEDLPD